jgi:hypothetical protein
VVAVDILAVALAVAAVDAAGVEDEGSGALRGCAGEQRF